MGAEIGSDRHQLDTGFRPVSFYRLAPFGKIIDDPLVAHSHNVARRRRQIARIRVRQRTEPLPMVTVAAPPAPTGLEASICSLVT